jgi:predicted transcriptional regulator
MNTLTRKSRRPVTTTNRPVPTEELSPILNRRQTATENNVNKLRNNHETKILKPPKTKEEMNRLNRKRETLEKNIQNKETRLKGLSYVKNHEEYKKARKNFDNVWSEWRYLHNVEMKG